MRRISTGSPQDLLTRTCTRSCKDTKRIPPGPAQDLLRRTCIPGQPFCASLQSKRTWKCHKMRFTREFQEKCHVPRRRQPFSTSKRSWNADGHVTRVILRLNLQEKRWGPRPGQTRYQPCVRDCAVETHMDISQERCMLEFTANMPGIRARSLISYRKDPSVWAHWLGNRRLFLECVARVPVSLWGSGGSKENS